MIFWKCRVACFDVKRCVEMCRQGAGKWLTEVVDLFEADIRTYESIMVNWRSKEDIEEPKGTNFVDRFCVVSGTFYKSMTYKAKHVNISSRTTFSPED